ncbi:MAG TPA: hypothetical protein VF828_02325 [Patescibacteria group bacterium]
MKFFRGFFIFSLMVIFFWLASPVEAKAASLRQATVRYDRMAINQPTNVYVKLVPNSLQTEAKVKLIFGTAVVGTNLSVVTTNLETGMTQLPGSLTVAKLGTSAVVVSGVTDLTVGSTYAFNISAGISTPAAPGQVSDSVETLTSGDVSIDKTLVASYYVGANNDLITITANVPPIFTFALSGNTDPFTTDLTSGSVSTTGGTTISISTNAARGWTAWVKSANQALSSTISGESIAGAGTTGSVTTCTNGVDCYVLDVGISTTGTGAGSLAVDVGYTGNGTTSGGAPFSLLMPIARRSGKTSGDVLFLKAHASVIATKAAATDYNDTLTVVAAGNF